MSAELIASCMVQQIVNLTGRIEWQRWYVDYLSKQNPGLPYAWVANKCIRHAKENSIVAEQWGAPSMELYPHILITDKVSATPCSQLDGSGPKLSNKTKIRHAIAILEKDIARLTGRLGALVASC